MARQEQKSVEVAVAGTGLAGLAFACTRRAAGSEVLEALDAIGGR
jgi:monoamine oxidase